MEEEPSGWHFWIDRGGTFTDLVARSPTGELVVRKVLSAAFGGDPVVAVIRELVGVAPGAPLSEGVIAEVRLGTTVATNALLERGGAPTLLLVNRGFADALWIGDQHRPDLFALRIERPDPLQGRVLEVGGRLAADGTELEPLQLDGALAAELRRARTDGYGSIAVALLHGAQHPRHECILGEWLRQLGFSQVSLSHHVSPLAKWVPRVQTTVVEAYVDPPLRSYLGQLQAELGPGCGLRVMQSSGGLITPAQLRAKDTILSGPAGGLVGACRIASAVELEGTRLGSIVGFDMGGTSTDVFHSAGPELPWERCSETEIGGFVLQAPMLAIHTVAAGGGSVVHVDGERLQVGPASAAADPGPACYRRGGPATVTDANLLLGRLWPEAFPAVFGPGADLPLDPAASLARFEALAAQLKPPGSPPHQIERLAEGALAIAVARMAEAIRRISIQRGHDLRKASLVCFGGAGGQHACALAEALGLPQVLLHPLAGVLSAYGMGLAEERVLRERVVLEPLQESSVQRLQTLAEALDAEALNALGDGVSGAAASSAGAGSSRQVTAWLRPRGGEVSLPVPLGPVAAMTCAFLQNHHQRYGYTPAGPPEAPLDLEVERLSVERVAAGAPLLPAGRSAPLRDPLVAASEEPIDGCPSSKRGPTTLPLFLNGAWHPATVLARERLRPGDRIQGPALITEATGTVVVALGWEARVLAGAELLLGHGPGGLGVSEAEGTGERTPVLALPGTLGCCDAPQAATHGQGGFQGIPEPTSLSGAPPADPIDMGGPALHPSTGATVGPRDPGSLADPMHPGLPAEPVDPVLLELFHHRFAAIAEQMGERLRLTSTSVNIRERLDFSCALFDRRGDLVANAPHIPVHLGSMGESVVSLLAAVARGERSPLSPGDAVVSNDPYNGGTHLPDLTVITPVFAGAGKPLFYVACRGHHADVGGLTPGSMPPFSRSLEEEGLLLDNVPFLERGDFPEALWRERLGSGDYPVRNPELLLADLHAQVAANRLGASELERLVAREGGAQVLAYMGHVQDNAAEVVRRAIDRLRDGAFRVELDDGAVIAVAVRIDRAMRRATVDFTGTSPQHPGNLNAPLAITKAVVLYVFRTLVGESIPLNAGCFRPLELVVPEGCLLRPGAPAAVVAGNVETSQAIANALFGALGVMAAAQGTMNNLSFGNGRCQYYETICGGTGAGVFPSGVSFDGADAVQSHMTNSRLTDPEVLESRFPVRLEAFQIRHGSGGAGRNPGGEGVVRRLRFLEPLTVSILSGSRRVPPFGLAGGGPGAVGCNRLERADGSIESLGGSAELAVEPGDLLQIATPGGGGYGT